MTASIPPPPELRAHAVREMLARVNDEQMIVLAGLMTVELCVLGAPKHSYFDEVSARAWLALKDRARAKLVQTYTQTLVDRGLLLSAPPTEQPASYALSTELGVVLAARCRPSFVIATAVSGAQLRQPACFALGDEADTLRALVVETPVLPDTDRRTERQLGPLAQCSAYVLGTREWTAGYLADWMIRPAPVRPEVQPGAPRTISRYHPVSELGEAGYQLSVRGDGSSAHIDVGSGRQPRRCDLDGLRTVMLDFIDGKLR
jgi:hypothetical protein